MKTFTTLLALLVLTGCATVHTAANTSGSFGEAFQGAIGTRQPYYHRTVVDTFDNVSYDEFQLFGSIRLRCSTNEPAYFTYTDTTRLVPRFAFKFDNEDPIYYGEDGIRTWSLHGTEAKQLYTNIMTKDTVIVRKGNWLRGNSSGDIVNYLEPARKLINKYGNSCRF